MATIKYDFEPQRAPFILDFWGKANSINQAGAGHHPLVHHSLDVAAVGAELISRDRERLRRIAAAAGIEVDALRSTLPFLLALHDIGKYARVFQGKSPDHWPVNVLGPFRAVAPGNSHVVAGFQILDEFSDNGASHKIFDLAMPNCRPTDRHTL